MLAKHCDFAEPFPPVVFECPFVQAVHVSAQPFTPVETKPGVQAVCVQHIQLLLARLCVGHGQMLDQSCT